MLDLLRDYLPWLLATWAIELPILAFVARGRAPLPRILAAGLVASGVTHPLLTFAWSRVVSPERTVAYLVSGEGLVFVAETAILWTLVYRGPGRGARGAVRDAALASLATNAASCAVGLVVATL